MVRMGVGGWWSGVEMVQGWSTLQLLTDGNRYHRFPCRPLRQVSWSPPSVPSYDLLPPPQPPSTPILQNHTSASCPDMFPGASFLLHFRILCNHKQKFVFKEISWNWFQYVISHSLKLSLERLYSLYWLKVERVLRY